MNKITTYIGRFSLFHNGHAACLDNAIATSNTVLVVIGSAFQARDTKNPFTYEERAGVIQNYIKEKYSEVTVLVSRHGLLNFPLNADNLVVIVPSFDTPEDHQSWERHIIDTTKTLASKRFPGEPVHQVLTGADRDASTYYLKGFGGHFTPELYTPVNLLDLKMNATELREWYYHPTDRRKVASRIPASTLHFLERFQDTGHYVQLVREYACIKAGKAIYESLPYPPIFVTVDAAVIYNGQVLVITRDGVVGKGLLALPGGYLEADETLYDGALRELKEETGLDLSTPNVARRHSVIVADHPSRSTRGRIITHCHVFEIINPDILTTIKPQTGEVESLSWIPLKGQHATENWFEDHFSLLRKVYNAYYFGA